MKCKTHIIILSSNSTDSVVDDGKSQTTFAFSNPAEGVDNTSSDERDDNHSKASSCLSNSSTVYVTEPLGPNSHASITEPLSPNSHASIKGLLGSNNKASSGSPEQYQQTINIANGSTQIHNIDKHETQVCEEGVTGVQKQQAQSRLHFSINFQTNHLTEDENILYEPVKNKNRRHKTKRKNSVEHEKCDEGKDNFEVKPPVCVGGHSLERSMDKVQYGSFEELHKEKSYEGNYMR